MTDATIALTGPDHRAAFRVSTFADVLRSEWVKLRSVRSTFWALTVTVVLGIALGAVISAAARVGWQPGFVASRLAMCRGVYPPGHLGRPPIADYRQLRRLAVSAGGSWNGSGPGGVCNGCIVCNVCVRACYLCS